MLNQLIQKDSSPIIEDSGWVKVKGVAALLEFYSYQLKQEATAHIFIRSASGVQNSEVYFNLNGSIVGTTMLEYQQLNNNASITPSAGAMSIDQLRKMVGGGSLEVPSANNTSSLRELKTACWDGGVFALPGLYTLTLGAGVTSTEWLEYRIIFTSRNILDKLGA